MPLTVDNNLTLINIRFGSTNNHSEVSFASHMNSFSAMTVVNIKIYWWVNTTHTEIVSHCIQYDNKNPFKCITINCSVENNKNIKNTCRKLIILFVYNTNFFHKNYTERIQNGLGFIKEVAVNSIIGISKIKQLRPSIIFEGDFLTSPLFQKKISYL